MARRRLRRFSRVRWDYCTVRFSDIDDVKKLLKDIGVTGFTWYPIANGYDHYPYAYAVHGEGGSNIITFAFRPYIQVINYQPDVNCTGAFRAGRFEVLLNFSGTGLDVFMDYLAKRHLSFEDALKSMYENRGHFTRLDLARTLYNYDYHYSAKYAAQQAYEGNLCTTARYCDWNNSFSSLGGNNRAYTSVGEGDTLYIGKSPLQLRIYNKLAEESPLITDDSGISHFAHSKYYSISRFEIQANHDKSQDLVRNWIKNGCSDLKTWQSFMKSHYKFISRQGQRKQRRRRDYKTATWYHNLVDVNIPYSQTPERPPRTTFKDSVRWIHRQVMPRLSTIIQARIEMYRQVCGNADKAVRFALRDFFYQVQDTDCRRHKVDRCMMNDWLTQEGFEAYYPDGTIVFQPRKKVLHNE